MTYYLPIALCIKRIPSNQMNSSFINQDGYNWTMQLYICDRGACLHWYFCYNFRIAWTLTLTSNIPFTFDIYCPPSNGRVTVSSMNYVRIHSIIIIKFQQWLYGIRGKNMKLMKVFKQFFAMYCQVFEWLRRRFRPAIDLLDNYQSQLRVQRIITLEIITGTITHKVKSSTLQIWSSFVAFGTMLLEYVCLSVIFATLIMFSWTV
jgi:hypothetical protein